MRPPRFGAVLVHGFPVLSAAYCGVFAVLHEIPRAAMDFGVRQATCCGVRGAVLPAYAAVTRGFSWRGYFSGHFVRRERKCPCHKPRWCAAPPPLRPPAKARRPRAGGFAPNRRRHRLVRPAGGSGARRRRYSRGLTGGVCGTGSRLVACGTMKYDCHIDTRLRGGRGGGHSLARERVWRFAGIGQRAICPCVHRSYPCVHRS